MEKAIIFNIQRYSLHDGGGIRTVIFFKGCPLTCPWCSNPESQKFEPELMRKQGLCINCSASSCYECTMKPKQCPTAALELVGREYTIDEVINEVEKDIAFYETTGGGVTLSGGEPLSQGLFCIELLKRLKQFGIDTAIETTGIGKWDIINGISDYIDTVLWDFKIMDKEQAKEIVHEDIDLMKRNFELLMKKASMKKNFSVIPRIPLIPEYTTAKSNIRQIAEFISQFGIKAVHILPFHQYGSSKYKALGKKYELADLRTLDKEEIIDIKSFFLSYSIEAIIGGN
jgi:pyruvate formate lyase activating enzyme